MFSSLIYPLTTIHISMENFFFFPIASMTTTPSVVTAWNHLQDSKVTKENLNMYSGPWPSR